MARASRASRVFVSSTFSDMKAERNALQERLWPRLRELCMQHGCRFQAIDLRWGVSEEAALDQQTMPVCLEEIRRCQRITPRPNFIVLLGQRKGWYRRDDNALPAEYVLSPREGRYEDGEAWGGVEAQLRAALLRAVEQVGLPQEARLKYEASATEQEIVKGALQVEDADEHVHCLFREIDDLPPNASAAGLAEGRHGPLRD